MCLDLSQPHLITSTAQLHSHQLSINIYIYSDDTFMGRICSYSTTTGFSSLLETEKNKGIFTNLKNSLTLSEIPWHWKNYFTLTFPWHIWTMCKSLWYFLLSFESVGLLVQKKRKKDFQDGGHGSHLGFLFGMILAIFYRQIVRILTTIPSFESAGLLV